MLVTRMTGGGAAIAALEAAGVEVVFGIPGVHTLAFYNALRESKIEHVLARHEQGAGFMADGYARATGKPGVALVITGPGVTNIATPVGEAFADSVPMVVLSSQVERPYAGHMRGNLHDIKDQSGVMSAVTKRSTVVDAFDQIATEVYRAVVEAGSGRPRPVHVEIPLDLLDEIRDYSEPIPLAPTTLGPLDGQAEEAAELLAGAECPLIYVGGGAIDAGSEVAELAELLGAPVLCSIMGKGVLSDRHPYSLGHAWDPYGESSPVEELLRRSDLVLVAGSKLGAQETRFWQMPLPERIVRIDIDGAELGLNYGTPLLGINADARVALTEILQVLRGRDGVTPKVEPEVVAVIRERTYQSAEPDDLVGQHIAALRETISDDGIIVQDMTMASYRMNDEYPVYAPRTYFFPSSYGTLGYSMPAAIGAKIGRPDAQVVAIAGDGGYQFTMQELATAIQYQLAIPIVIFNDSTYTAVKSEMEWKYEGWSMAVDLVNPDYLKLADAYGIQSVRAERPEALSAAVKEAFTRSGPTIIDVPIPAG